MREAELQAHLLRTLNAPGSGTRVWRQNAGHVETIDGYHMELAPEGAGDLVGLVEPEGWHIEVECKGARTRHRPKQVAWGKMLKRKGGLYVVVRVDKKRTKEENVAAAMAAVHKAIEQKRAN